MQAPEKGSYNKAPEQGSNTKALNWKEINLILDELDLAGSLIRGIHGPTPQSIVLELFKRGVNSKLLISLSNPHLHRLTRKLDNPQKPFRFVTFLRAHIKNGKIKSAVQIEGERIIRIDVLRERQETSVWIRLWTAAANIIVTNCERKILDTFHRRPKRDEIAGQIFNPEPGFSGSGKKKDSYAVRELPGEGSFNEKIETAFFDRESEDERITVKNSVLKNLNLKEAGALARLEKLKEKMAENENLEQLRETGDLIKSSLHKIKRGDKWLLTEDFFHGNRKLDIKLKPEASPIGNAEFYYKKYRKAKKAGSQLVKEIDDLELRLQQIINKKNQVISEEDITALKNLAEKPVQNKKEKHTSIPGLIFISKPFSLIVGRTSKENDLLLRKYVNGNDYWFHSRDYPGAYIFIKAVKGKSIPLETMLDAGNLAIYYSKGRSSGAGDIYYTQVKYLRRVKGGKTGLVIPTNENNLFIKLDDRRLDRLKNSQSTY